MANQSNQGRLSFEYEVDEKSSTVTSLGGLPIVLETMRALGLSDAVEKHLRLSQREREHDERALVESIVMLMAAGGDCIDDINVLRTDEALCKLLGQRIASPETVRRFLYAFHDEELVQKAASETRGRSYIPEESAPLRSLATCNEALVRAVATRAPVTSATIDADATIIESSKREAKRTYEGERGYQPLLAVWAERNLVVADEFRDGNVTSFTGLLPVVERAFAALPSTVTERSFRGDTAFYVTDVLTWLYTQDIKFTIGAKLSVELKQKCVALPEDKWIRFEDRGDQLVDVADVRFIPAKWPLDVRSPRYVAIRFTNRQKDLLGSEEEEVRYLAIVTNKKDRAKQIVEWHWGKAGSIEHVHDVVKNELGGGVLPCGRFGANAAWFRLAVMTHNVLSALKAVALPPDLADARPKRLRFQVFTIPATVIQHARKMYARVADSLSRASRLVTARANLWAVAPAV